MGGYVLRGATHGSFHGVYVFGDKVSKRIWGMTQENGVMKTIHQLAVAPQEITAFAVDDRGGVFAVGYQGMVYNLDFSGSAFDETSDIPSC